MATNRREPTGAARLRLTEGSALVSVDGPIDAANAPFVGALLRRGHNQRDRVVLDLGDVPFIAAAGITALVRCDFPVVLRRPSALCRRVLDVVGLSDRFEIDEYAG